MNCRPPTSAEVGVTCNWATPLALDFSRCCPCIRAVRHCTCSSGTQLTEPAVGVMGTCTLQRQCVEGALRQKAAPAAQGPCLVSPVEQQLAEQLLKRRGILLDFGCNKHDTQICSRPRCLRCCRGSSRSTQTAAECGREATGCQLPQKRGGVWTATA